MRNPMTRDRRRFFAALTACVAVPLYGFSVQAGQKTYKYRCPKCKLIQEYGVPGVKKCPNDGTTMIRMSS